MRNRTRSNDSEKRARCQSIPDARFVVYASQSFPQTAPPCPLIPRPGGGGLFKARRQERTSGEGVGQKKEKKRGERACFHRFAFSSRRLSPRSRLRHLIICGIPSRLVMPSRSGTVSSSSRHRLVACLPCRLDRSFSPMRLVRLLVVASRGRVVIDDVPVAAARCACGPWGLRLVSRLVERGDFGFSSHLGGGRMGGGSRLAVSGPVLACLDAVGGWWQCRSRHRRSRLLPIVLWLRGVDPCGVPPPIWLVIACFLPLGLSLLPRAVYPI